VPTEEGDLSVQFVYLEVGWGFVGGFMGSLAYY
jgi:hypothetical protein